jgi:hypothetical protein
VSDRRNTPSEGAWKAARVIEAKLKEKAVAAGFNPVFTKMGEYLALVVHQESGLLEAQTALQAVREVYASHQAYDKNPMSLVNKALNRIEGRLK